MINLIATTGVMLALFQADSINLKDLINWGPAILQLGLVLVFLLRIAPTWKEVRLRELELRAREGEFREKEAAALSKLADVLQSVGVEQRRAAEVIEITQRVNAEASDHLLTNVRILNDRVTRIEDNGGTTLAQMAVDVLKLTQKIDSMIKERNVEPETAAAGA